MYMDHKTQRYIQSFILVSLVSVSFLSITKAQVIGESRGNQEQKKIFFKDSFDSTASPDWRLMRMQFAVQDGKLQVVSAPREGFEYGHGGHGRSAAAFVHLGDQSWKDYRVEMDVFGGGAGEFNPHAISVCMRGSFSVFFHTQDYKENWNEPSRSGYFINVNPIPKLCEGGESPVSGLYRINNWYAATQKGWCGGIARNYFIKENGLSEVVTSDIEAFWLDLVTHEYLDRDGRILPRIASTNSPEELELDPRYKQDFPIIYQILKANYCAIPGGTKTLQKIDGNLWHIDEVNHVVIEVRGKLISTYINGIKAIDNYKDIDPDALTYGGIGVQWEWDNTGWIDNVLVTQL